MSNTKDIAQTAKSGWQPDVYYFPIQVDAELQDIQNNVLGKVLTLIEALGLDSKREKATKDLVRTIVKEQMIKSRDALDGRLNTLLKLGMQPIDMQSAGNRFAFTTGYVVTPIYEEGDMDEPRPNTLYKSGS